MHSKFFHDLSVKISFYRGHPAYKVRNEIWLFIKSSKAWYIFRMIWVLQIVIVYVKSGSCQSILAFTVMKPIHYRGAGHLRHCVETIRVRETQERLLRCPSVLRFRFAHIFPSIHVWRDFNSNGAQNLYVWNSKHLSMSYSWHIAFYVINRLHPFTISQIVSRLRCTGRHQYYRCSMTCTMHIFEVSPGV